MERTPIAKKFESGTKLSASDLPNLTRPYYDFAGWYIGNYKVQEGYANVTVSAKFTPKKYSIFYNLNGGTSDSTNPSEYTIESETIVLSSPSRVGYVFAGWYSTSDFSGSEVKEISSTSHGDVVLWAKWDLDPKVKKLIEITAKDIPVLSLEKLEKGANLLSLSGDITDEDLIAVGTFIRELTYGYTVHLDLSNVKGITKIPKECFDGCFSRLAAVVIPEGIVSIEKEAFSLSYLREGVYLSKSLISIEDMAFSFLECESIIIPKNVRSLYGSELFSERSLKRIIFEDIENWCVKNRYNGKVLAENINLADPENNVTLLTETYCYELFEKKYNS